MQHYKFCSMLTSYWQLYYAKSDAIGNVPLSDGKTFSDYSDMIK